MNRFFKIKQNQGGKKWSCFTVFPDRVSLRPQVAWILTPFHYSPQTSPTCLPNFSSCSLQFSGNPSKSNQCCLQDADRSCAGKHSFISTTIMACVNNCFKMFVMVTELLHVINEKQSAAIQNCSQIIMFYFVYECIAYLCIMCIKCNAQ